MAAFFLIFFGSGVGGVLRYLSSEVLSNWISSPLWTIVLVNSLGSFLIGAANPIVASELIRKFFMVGVLGGFTTFSSYSLLVVLGLNEKDLLFILVELALSVFVTLLSARLGVQLTSSLFLS